MEPTDHKATQGSHVVRRALDRLLLGSVDNSSIVFFRIAFGAILLWEVSRYFANGWIYSNYIGPRMHFTYYGFDWVRPWPGFGMYIHFAILAVLATMIMLGLWYRIATTLFFLGFTYVFLLDQAQYLNHFYLVSLISMLMIFVPAHRAFSIDSLTRFTVPSSTAPAWALSLLRFQIGVPYFFGGLAKLNADWLRGQPMRMWLAERTDFPLIGHLFHEAWIVAVLNYGSLLFDLLIVPALLWRRTRPYAFPLAIVFNLSNWQLFHIGIFPWFMIAATTLFLPPEWPRLPRARPRTMHAPGNTPLRRNLTFGLVGAYILVQLVVPLRHLLYPGNVSWTEEGHRFSWHMKLRDKQATARFFVTDPDSPQLERREVNALYYLTEDQYDEMAARPQLVLQFAHALEAQLQQEGSGDVAISALVKASLNGRERQLLIDPEVDLTQVSPSLPPAPWIEPLVTPLRHALTYGL